MAKRARHVVAAFQMSADGYLQGTDGAVDWIDSWSDALDLVPGAGAAVIGGGTFSGYEELWGAIAADPASAADLLGRAPTPGELEYARWTQRTPHYVLSATADQVHWSSAQLVRSLGELEQVLARPGADVYAVGGAALISSLLRAGFLDELALIVCPVILGGGKDPFAGISNRQALQLISCREGRAGAAVLNYRVNPR